MEPAPSSHSNLLQANLREALRFFGEATGNGEVRTLDGALGIFSGLDYGVFNIGLLDDANGTSPSIHQCLSVDSLRVRLAACATFFESRTHGWSTWICEEALEREARSQLSTLMAEHGLRRISVAPGMVAEKLHPPVAQLPEIECIPVTDESLRHAFGGLTSVSFDLPMSVVQSVYYPERAWKGGYRGFVGKVDGRIVSIVAIVNGGGALGVYSLATMPEFRRQGYGEALMRTALAREQTRTGVSRIVLQSTEAGHRLYRRMGFDPVARFSVYWVR